ncbi:disease resistance protein RPS5-like [Syzygium oleosum]|uniref:disease resistance protein RPS5-like n=1 Tax=Syzygium oleosum TaxID=219896 RepID=UPI0024B9C7E2|nr:disease resistance protein RPS5-like [Syzygium oleosum]XP_056167725.1 disease resistance protein RPS5-like [Syzygium oleosum]
MDFASPLLQLVKELWGLAKKPLGYIYFLKDNVDSLKNATEDLKAVSYDVKKRVEREEKEERALRTKQVATWLGKVQEFVSRVDQVLRDAGERDQIKCLSRCLPPNCWSGYKLGKRVNQMLNEARELPPKEGEFDTVTSPLPPPRVLGMPMDKTVGLDSSFKKVWEWLVDKKQVGMIGLYGIGGVGKTTLMKRINEELSRANHGFDVVIWVVVSRQVNKDRIQDAIRKRLDIEDELWKGWSWDERVHHLRKDLNKKKFVLLIDDLWGRLDLPKIGVPRPSPENGSKVVFTTRSEQVCDQMAAEKTFKVQCLMPEEALELFENNVGKPNVHSHPNIPELAKDIVRECKGLPLALITVGQAMAGRKDPHEWKHALTTLRNNPYKLSDMVDEVYHILEFSYNSLNDSTAQLCFLYCCLFPEDYPIITDELIELWIGEGLLGDINDLYSMRDKGKYVLGSLEMACLLESVRDEDEESWVKMHDVIRDMATWIAHDHGKRENKLLVIEKDEDMSEDLVFKWGESKKVSLWGKWIRNIDKKPPQCSQLETLFVRETEVTFMPKGFFDSMTACLAVLNLSSNGNIESFPEGICNLINLRYLNLSVTGISELPKEIKNLTRLRWLLLDDMLKGNVLIPTGAITSLPLNVFSQWNFNQWKLEELMGEWGGVKEEETVEELKEEEMVEELGCMQHLTDLSICVHESSSAQKIFQSPNLRRRIRRACIDNRNGNLTSIVINYSPASTNGFSHLETLCLFQYTELSEMKITQRIGQAPNYFCFPNLVDVWVKRCGLLDLSWLVHAPKLRKLTVTFCESMEKIIGDGFAREELAASGLFSRLESLRLIGLPKLTSICDQTLSFPQGVRFFIVNCPGLRKLPLDSSSARGSFEVEGDKRWWTWAEFEWDPTARVTLQLDEMEGPAKEMTFGEAARKVKDESRYAGKIGFLPRGGPSE